MSVPGSRPGERLYGESAAVQYCVWSGEGGEVVHTVHLAEQSTEGIRMYGVLRRLTLTKGPVVGTIPKKDEDVLRTYNKDGMVQNPCRQGTRGAR